MRNSLQSNLYIRVSAVVVVFTLISSLGSGWLAFMEASEEQDNLLRQVASLLDEHSIGRGAVNKQGEQEDALILQRLGVSSPHNLPIPENLEDGYYTLVFAGHGWRVLIYTEKANHARLAVSQQTAVRDELARNMVFNIFVPMLLLLPVLLIVVRLTVNFGIKPVNDLAKKLNQNNISCCNHLTVEQAPEELRPFLSSMNSLLARLDQVITQQRRFVADAAHELRTPVAGLSLLAENLLDAKSLEDIRRQLTPLREGLMRISTLVVQLLDLARLQGEKRRNLELVNLKPLVTDIIAEIMPLASNKEIDLGMLRNESVAVNGNPDILRILLHNAIENAIRYTPNGGKVDISLYVDQGIAVFRVDDTGPGINDSERDIVFEPFYRGADTTEPGNGLGLAICKEIAARLDGVIALDSSEKGGLSFTYSQSVYPVDSPV